MGIYILQRVETGENTPTPPNAISSTIHDTIRIVSYITNRPTTQTTNQPALRVIDPHVSERRNSGSSPIVVV